MKGCLDVGIYEDNTVLLLEELADFWCRRLPAFFPSAKDAEAFIKAHMEMTGRERITPCKVVKWNKRTDYYFCADELNRFISDNLKGKFTNPPPMTKAWAEKPGDKCRHSISDKGFYAADWRNLLLSSFVASSWIGLGIPENDDFNAARLAVRDIEPRLVNAVRNNAIRQIEPDGFARVKEGEYIHGGLFLEADIKAWAKSEYPRCQLSEFYAVDETLIELHENKINIYRSCEAFDSEPPQETFISIDKAASNQNDIVPEPNKDGRRKRQIDALCLVLLGMGYIKNESGSIVVTVGNGEIRKIHQECVNAYPALFPPVPKLGEKSSTFNGIWKAANSSDCGARVVVINARGG